MAAATALHKRERLSRRAAGLPRTPRLRALGHPPRGRGPRGPGSSPEKPHYPFGRRGTLPRALTPETRVPAASVSPSLPRPLLCRVPARARRPRVKKERTHLTCALPAPCPTPIRPTLSGRPGFAPPAEIPHPHHRRRRRRLRQPSEISARRPGARRGSKTRRLLLRQTRLYVCGAGAHAQTPSSLLLLSQPPPPATAAASSSRRSPLLRLRSGAGPSSADAARDPGIRWSRRKALVTTTTAPSPPAALPRHPPTHPPRSPTPTNPTSRSFERRRLQSLQQPLWPPTPPRKESPPPPAAPSGPGRGSSGVRTSRLRRKRTRAARIVGASARPAALRGGSGAGPLPPRGRVPSRGACPEGGKCSGSMAASDGEVPGLPLPPLPPRPGRAPRGPGVSARPPAPRCWAHRTRRSAAAPLRASPRRPQPRPAFPHGAAAASPGGLKGSPSKAEAAGAFS
ncbi:sterile alpha motif domain-containing protein 1-like [Physeter macrocephalus]|uniref:Sterile alpha motif domain-containing protein 1-like n=1 Tax=Physeter macrocephalus TaxID=9755 RepID=A0A455BZE4_PHYMC|nr:sterile alpha motif domain-containing protein 1-like [Physeter catodon]|eukprot:XP_028353153.1 atherin-like [Physeter catodon]